MNLKSRRKYDQDFKRNAVLLCAEPGRTVIEVAQNLGINKDILYWWRREVPQGKRTICISRQWHRSIDSRTETDS